MPEINLINPMYMPGSHAIESEINRMIELEWPLKVSAGVLPLNLNGKIVGDIGAGPNPNLGKLVESRGGKYVALDENSQMVVRQKRDEVGRSVIQGDILNLPFRDGQFDILHVRFLLMNLPANQRALAIRELARVAREKTIIIDYNWEKFQSKNPLVQSFIINARRLGELAGSDLDLGGKLKGLVEATLPEKRDNITEKTENRGPIKDYKTLSGLAKSMQGLGRNLQNIETQTAKKENRSVNQELMEELNYLITEMEKSESEFDETTAMVDQSTVIPYISPDIVAVIF